MNPRIPTDNLCLKPYLCWGTWKPVYAGGGQFDPLPSKSHVWCPNMTNDTSLESYNALLWESAKKIQICKNIFWRVVCNKLVCNSLQNLCNPFLYVKGFPKIKKKYQNLTTESESKQRFSLLQEKVVIQAVCLRTQAVSIKAQF